MAGNIINIQFNEDLINGSGLTITGVKTLINTTSFEYYWQWAPVRTSGFKVSVGTPTDLPGERTAINFVEAFNLDCNGTGLYTVTRSGTLVTIVAQNTNISSITFDNAYSLKTQEPPAFANIIFTFGTISTTVFDVVSVQNLINTTDRCGKVNVRVTANQIVKSVTKPVTLTPNATAFTFTYSRGSAGIIEFANNAGELVSISFTTLPLLSPVNFTIDVTGSPNGSSMIATNNLAEGLVLAYGLSQANIFPENYQSENSFSGLAPGDYILYIKDQFDCVKTKTFTVSAFNSNREPYFYISKSNSIRFANRVIWGDNSNYKNDENTLSCEVENVLSKYQEVQQFQAADVITIQFKSNFTHNTASVINQDNTIISIPVFKKTSFIGVKDKRDAMKISLIDGRTGIYFASGQTYDYDTTVPNGTYALNGSLPYWASYGTYFSVNNIWNQIDEVYFDESLGADVIIIDAVYAGLPVVVIAGAIYNNFPYEVYEFTIAMGDYNNQDITVEIDCTDLEFNSLQLKSEMINVKTRHADTVVIEFSNNANNDVYYATGISHKIRQPINKVSGMIDSETNTLKTDISANLLDAEIYEVDEFEFEPVTKEIMRNITMALSHENVTINDVGYVINGSVEVEGPLERSNLYNVKAKMIKTGVVYGNQNADPVNNEGAIELPGLVKYEDGFIKY